MKTLSDLIKTTDPAWPLIQEWLAEAANPVEILPRNPAATEAELIKTQVTTRSVMGAVVYETGSILIDHGWLRILGSSSAKLPRGLASWNIGRTQSEPATPAPYYLIADDAAGGYFAINGGGLDGTPGNVFYLPPDTLEWEDMQFSYSDFVYWLFCGDVAKFYEPYFFEGWQDAVAKLGCDETFSSYPFLWSKEAQDMGVSALSRKAVSADESYRLMIEFVAKLGS